VLNNIYLVFITKIEPCGTSVVIRKMLI